MRELAAKTFRWHRFKFLIQVGQQVSAAICLLFSLMNNILKDENIYMRRIDFNEYFELRLNYQQVILLFRSCVISMKQNNIKKLFLICMKKKGNGKRCAFFSL